MWEESQSPIPAGPPLVRVKKRADTKLCGQGHDVVHRTVAPDRVTPVSVA